MSSLEIICVVKAVSILWNIGLKTLKTLVIAEGVSAIGNAAFEGSSITSLVIPASVRDIGVRALSGAKNLRSVFVRNGSVAEIFLRGEGRDDLIKRTGSLF